MNNKKIQIWLPLLFSITMIAGMYLGYKMRDNMPRKSFFHVEKRKLIPEMMELIQDKYVDEVNMSSLADTAIEAILSQLDPHSVFIPAEELQQINEELAGKFFGIGIEFNIFEDTLHITHVLKDGPAHKVGMLIGDKLIQIENNVVAGKKLSTEQFVKLLKGDRGTKISLTLLRGAEQKKVIIARDAIALLSIDANYMINQETGYIRLNKFSSPTYREFMKALTGLKKQGAKKLILDLRGNGGGFLEGAIEIADEFLDADKLITYTEGKHSGKKEYRCRRAGQFEQGALVVLADEGTASASEVLIGALQDWDRATIIGRRSFGKGLVQEQFNLTGNNALRLTIARYYTPIGRSIQRSYTNGGEAYYNEIINRYHNGETQNADSVKNNKTKIYKTSKGKTVYGGGGISPDFFIPLDTNNFNTSHSRIYYQQIIPTFAYTFFLQNKSLLNTYKTASHFMTDFSFTEEYWKQFIHAAKRDSIILQPIAPGEKENIIRYIKLSMAKLVWHSEGLFQAMNTYDEMIRKALEILHP